MYKLIVYVPDDYLEPVKGAMFNAGAGRIGQYEHCCWQVKGLGQFKPMVGSQPFIGEQDALETVEEYKLELVCEVSIIKDVVAALKNAHPYEEPAYQVLEVLDF